jgi:hypothetical protein
VAVRNATDTANLVNVRRISGEGDGACALLRNGEVRCWGVDATRQLGNGEAENGDKNLPVPVLNVAGTGHLTGVAAASAPPTGAPTSGTASSTVSRTDRVRWRIVPPIEN